MRSLDDVNARRIQAAFLRLCELNGGNEEACRAALALGPRGKSPVRYLRILAKRSRSFVYEGTVAGAIREKGPKILRVFDALQEDLEVHLATEAHARFAMEHELWSVSADGSELYGVTPSGAPCAMLDGEVITLAPSLSDWIEEEVSALVQDSEASGRENGDPSLLASFALGRAFLRLLELNGVEVFKVEALVNSEVTSEEVAPLRQLAHLTRVLGPFIMQGKVGALIHRDHWQFASLFEPKRTYSLDEPLVGAAAIAFAEECDVYYCEPEQRQFFGVHRDGEVLSMFDGERHRCAANIIEYVAVQVALIEEALPID